MNGEPVVICQALSKRGIDLAKKFKTAGRFVIGVDSAVASGKYYSINHKYRIDTLIDQLLISTMPMEMAKSASAINGHCGIIEHP